MTLLPHILSREQPDSDQLALQLDIAPGLLVFQGHFEGCPLVPGIAQVDWALRFAARELGLTAPCLELRHLKFSRLMRPGVQPTLHLRVERSTAALRLSFTYADAGGTYSQGTALLSEET